VKAPFGARFFCGLAGAGLRCNSPFGASDAAPRSTILEPDAIAREAARAIAADTDPSLPSRVEAALGGPARDCVAAFLVDAARHACRIGAGVSVNGNPLAAQAIERRLRREFGLDDGMPSELDAIVAAIAEQVALHHASAE
jgi:hypothetical protein